MKTTWILVAGVSRDAGYPLVSDFFRKSYYDQWVIRQGLTGFNEDAKALRAEVDQWVGQGESVNSLMLKYHKSGDIVRTNALNMFIVRTLDMVRWHYQGRYHLPYMQAFAHLVGATNAAVVSFNYDTLVEEQLVLMSIPHILRDRGRDLMSHCSYNFRSGGQLLLQCSRLANFD